MESFSLLQEWNNLLQMGFQDPVLGPYYDAAWIVMILLAILLSLVLLYYLTKCAAKTAAWIVDMAFRLAMGLLILSVAMAVVFVVLPWISNSLGYGTLWFRSPDEYGYGPTAGGDGQRQTWRFSGQDIDLDYVEIEVDPVTGKRVRVPKLGDGVYRHNREAWRRKLRTMADNVIGQEVIDLWIHGPDANWWTWTAFSYLSRTAAKTVWYLATDVGQGLWSTAGTVYSTVRNAGTSDRPVPSDIDKEMFTDREFAYDNGDDHDHDM